MKIRLEIVGIGTIIAAFRTLILRAMKTFAFIISAILISGLVSAQDIESGKADTPSRKELRKQKLEADYQKNRAIIDSLQFVLEADWLSNQWGSRIPVNSTLNFIRVDSAEAVIQTGSNFSMGHNGLGGTTATGEITHFSVNTNDKRKSISIRMDVSTRIGFYNVFIDISGSGAATATMSGVSAGKLIFYGRLVPLTSSYAFKGSSY